MKERVVYLEITSWMGVSIGAEHFYGSLSSEGRKVDLLRVLSSREARRLNRKDHFSTYRAGSKTYRWRSKEQIVKAALKRWKKEFPDGKALLLGMAYCADPQPVLAAPKELRNELDWMAAEFVRTTGAESENVSDRWWKKICEIRSG